MPWYLLEPYQNIDSGIHLQSIPIENLVLCDFLCFGLFCAIGRFALWVVLRLGLFSA
jgi:hypothetical protein